MAGLDLGQKKRFGAKHWVVALIFITVISSAAGMLLYWYMTGIRPPVLPLPASALANPNVDESEVTQEQIEKHTVPDTHPRYISIPSLNINKVRVHSVGLNNKKEIDTPKNISDTAWYDQSALPGQGYGAVVINGHNGGITRNGVFAKLAELKNNDEIIIERGDGEKFTYRVVENKTETLLQANLSGMKRLFTPYDKTSEGLGLITCAGNWVPRDQVFDKRVLVRAVIVE